MWLTALAMGLTGRAPFFPAPTSRCVAPRMGGLTGLPRIPPEALSATKRFNPGCEYTEPIATLWRDLETLYGNEDVAGLGGSRTYRDTSRLLDSGVKTNKFRGFTRDIDVRVATVLKAVRREPSLLNPEQSNRFEFARSKAILVDVLGSQQAAIIVMQQDPSILQVGDALEEMSPATIRARAATASLLYTLSSNFLLLALLPLLAYAANEVGYDVPQLAEAQRALEGLGVGR